MFYVVKTLQAKFVSILPYLLPNLRIFFLVVQWGFSTFIKPTAHKTVDIILTSLSLSALLEKKQKQKFKNQQWSWLIFSQLQL